MTSISRLKRLLARAVPPALKARLRAKLGVPSQETSLRRLKQLGFNPATILDIGAYKGDWTAAAHTLFPDARILMIEGQRGLEPELAKTKDRIPGADYRIALLGSRAEEVTFNIYDTASSVLTETNDTGARPETRTLELLDEVVPATGFLRFDMIKLDTQGYELEILRGGATVLSTAEAVLLEVSFLDIYQGCPLVHDVLAFMHERGFAVYDICSLMHRPYDGALFQSDLLFLKRDSPYRASKRWI